ncbi:hypothetical protein [Fredinandcohnia sp. 179-A 10B2 NHS]|uniref:YfjL-like protein n=1 Tax=Fredinandcohnia sp. 179-A 10B2 NHS TaxID=3235176 RepID=UPI0039A05382
MKKKKIISSVILALLVLFVLYVYNAFNGNPISKFYATKVVENYLSETYPEREFRVDEGFYNFKFSEYSFNVIEIGSVGEQESKEYGPREYEFTVRGFIKPFVNIDSIYTENLDQPLITKLSEEAQNEIQTLLAKEVPSVAGVGVMIEVQKGTYPETTEWNKELKLEKPIDMHIVLDATTSSKDDVFKESKQIQKILNENGYNYGSVNINANVIEVKGGDISKDELGYVKFALSFGTDTEIKKKDIEEFN